MYLCMLKINLLCTQTNGAFVAMLLIKFQPYVQFIVIIHAGFVCLIESTGVLKRVINTLAVCKTSK